MGLFSRLFKKQGKENTERLKEQEPYKNKKRDRVRTARLNTKTERLAYIKENCEMISESMRQIDEAKVEYQAVTSYLTDMQRIDMIPREQRETLEDAARKIINLNMERNKFQNKNYSITDVQYRLFERYEMQIPKELASVKESEEYQGMIKQDMERLEQEKQNFLGEEEEIINKQSFLRGIAITTSVIVILLFGVFAALSGFAKSNMTLPFLLTVLMGMACALYIFMEARKNSQGIRIVQAKLNKIILLMNKVTIKSVNNRNFLEYTYSKYMVDGYEHLRTRWEEYVKLKDETKRYQSNTELLEFYHNELVHELNKYGIVDSEIWIYQPTAILDSREMVEVRHRLNVRRQKLRERIDANQKQKAEAVQTIKDTVKAYPDCEEEAVHLLKRYKLHD